MVAPAVSMAISARLSSFVILLSSWNSGLRRAASDY
jgi:hypothetical protein